MLNKNNLYKIFIILIILAGIIVRIKAYLLQNSLWLDESALALSILKRNLFGFFTPLEHFQKAPPIFMMLTELATYMFGNTKELALRSISLISSILALFVFFRISTEVLKNKFAILFANYLFSLNFYIIFYSQTFKQYSSDVLLVLLAIHLFSKFDLEKASIKKIMVAGFLTIILLLSSFPALFVVGAFICLYLPKCMSITKKNIKFNLNNIKTLTIYSLPLVIFGILYYILFLFPLRTREITQVTFWNDGFLSPTINSFGHIIKHNIEYFFYPNLFAIVLLIPIILGAYFLVKEKNTINKLILLTIGFTFLASITHLYPIKERVVLYLIPFCIIYLVKPLEISLQKNKITTFFLICLYLISLLFYNPIYISKCFKYNAFSFVDARTSMKILKENYNKSDIIVYNQASDSDLEYYSHYFNFKPTRTILIPHEPYTIENYNNFLNSLPKNNTYWFYISFDYSEKPTLPFIANWVVKNNIKFKAYSYKKSRVIYMKL